ncbi:MAG: urate hydroxylase PuuD [Betaproteobacteria bacterium]|nr:urate hydroxylase PuuD [Betaproteobacteria bacterium]
MDLLIYGLGRWLHIGSGVLWVGLLWYFNLVQVPGLKSAGADGTAAGITKHIAPRALELFRWSSLSTLFFGFLILGDKAGSALMFADRAYYAIGVGAWLGIIMFLNVWGLIWPNQKKILNLYQYAKTPASDAEKNKARRVALLASRTNMMLSIPMLFFMVASGGVFRRSFFG